MSSATSNELTLERTKFRNLCRLVIRRGKAGLSSAAETLSVATSQFDSRYLIFDSSLEMKGLWMTYLEVVFSYQTLPGENELRAIDNMREVYGIQRVRFNEKEKTVRVLYDASRMKQDAVAKMLRQAGIDVQEPMALA